MKILIVDDEALARERLCGLIAELGGHEVVGEAANGRQALAQVSALLPDTILMDIRMPEMDGMEAALHLAALEGPPAIIFTTAYDDHALAAFEVNATDYLLKPIRKEHLERALGKARQINKVQLSAMRRGGGELRTRRYISARVRGGLQLVPVTDVVYFKADQKYVTVRYRGGEVLIEDSLKALEEEFCERFARIHRNSLVDVASIASMEKIHAGNCRVRLRGMEDTLEVSRRHVTELRRRLLAG
ncbi:MAG: LytTR family DNA-binding domain-containing protein [Gammaproteobacteria bacterium]|nr:LytTR family DNA-binding domain-containing protein [Gammaproteobacteria bacterium]